MLRHILTRILSTVAMAGLCLVLSPSPIQGQTDPEDAAEFPDRAWAQLGADLYQENCAPCHGPEGAGDGPVLAEMDQTSRDFTDVDALSDRTPLQWLEITRNGRIENLMPPWENQLSEAQMGDLVAHLWHLSTSAAELERGGTLWHAHRDRLDGQETEAAWIGKAMAMTPGTWSETFLAAWAPDLEPPPTASELRAMHRHLQAQVLVPPWASPTMPGDGALQGTVRVRSPDTALPASMMVTLTASVEDRILAAWESPVDELGRFSFSDMDVSPRLIYQAQTHWDGLAFASAPVALSSTARMGEIPLDVHAPSTSQGTLAVQELRLILSLTADSLLIGETVKLVNTEPFVYVGETDPTLGHAITARIPVDPRALDITLAEAEDARYVRDGNWLLDSDPVFPPPQGNWVTLGYALPLPAEAEEWTQSWPYPLRSATVMISELPGLRVELPGFASRGRQFLGEDAYTVWQADALPEGRLTVRFAGLPGITAPATLYAMPLWLPLGVAGFLILLLAALALILPAARPAPKSTS